MISRCMNKQEKYEGVFPKYPRAIYFRRNVGS